MNSQNQKPDKNLLDAYLDDTLSEEERKVFALKILQDSALQKELELARQIDHSIQGQYVPPRAPSAELLERLRLKTLPEGRAVDNDAPAKNKSIALNNSTPLASATSPQISSSEALHSPSHSSPLSLRKKASNTQKSIIAIAAILAWVVVGFQVSKFWNGNQPKNNPYSAMTMVQAYELRVAKGFVPDWVCETDHEFAKTFYERQGQGLLLDDLPDGTAMLGLAYMPGLAPTSTAMLAEVDKKPVLLFVDKKSLDREIPPPDPKTGLFIYRKELKSLVMYEISPFPTARIIDHVVLSEVPPMEEIEPDSNP